MGVQRQDKKSLDWGGNRHTTLSSPFNMEIYSCVSHIILFNIKIDKIHILYSLLEKNLDSGK